MRSGNHVTLNTLEKRENRPVKFKQRRLEMLHYYPKLAFIHKNSYIENLFNSLKPLQSSQIRKKLQIKGHWHFVFKMSRSNEVSDAEYQKGLDALSSLISGRVRSDGKNWSHAFEMMKVYLEVRLLLISPSQHPQ